jgi:hypothetical protein
MSAKGGFYRRISKAGKIISPRQVGSIDDSIRSRLQSDSERSNADVIADSSPAGNRAKVVGIAVADV